MRIRRSPECLSLSFFPECFWSDSDSSLQPRRNFVYISFIGTALSNQRRNFLTVMQHFFNIICWYSFFFAVIRVSLLFLIFLVHSMIQLLFQDYLLPDAYCVCSSTNSFTSFASKSNGLTKETILSSIFSISSSVAVSSPSWTLKTALFNLQQSGHNFF